MLTSLWRRNSDCTKSNALDAYMKVEESVFVTIETDFRGVVEAIDMVQA